jgi:hypothetical protein
MENYDGENYHREKLRRSVLRDQIHCGVQFIIVNNKRCNFIDSIPLC